MRLLILVPAPEEAGPLVRALDPRIRVIVTGVGPAAAAAAAARALSAEPRPDAVILAGIAGAYPASGLRPGDVVAVAEERTAGLPARYADRWPATLHLPLRTVCGLTVTASGAGLAAAGRPEAPDASAATTAEPDGEGTALRRTAPAANSAPAVENMEGAAVLAVAAALEVPAAEVRAVSNRVGEPFAAWRIPEALDALARTLAEVTQRLSPGEEIPAVGPNRRRNPEKERPAAEADRPAASERPQPAPTPGIAEPSRTAGRPTTAAARRKTKER